MSLHTLFLTRKEKIGNALLIVAGSVLFGVSVAVFLNPSGIVTGGVSGIAIILHKLFDWNTGLLFLLLNLPILFAGLFLFGRRFMVSTVIATLLSSLATDLTATFLVPHLPVLTDQLLIGIIGGAASGAGLGLILRTGATTGGTDIIVKIIRRKYAHFKPGMLFFLIDSLILIAAAIATRSFENGLYSAIALFFSSALIDLVIYGRDKAVLAFIITVREKEIAEHLLTDLEVGATLLPGAGAYSAEPRQVILCAVKKQNFPNLRHIVNALDPDAFLIVTSASEIYGEGFKRYNSDF